MATLSAMPTVGHIAPRFSSSKYTYYSFVFHAKYLVIYRFTSKTIYIQALRSIQMQIAQYLQMKQMVTLQKLEQFM